MKKPFGVRAWTGLAFAFLMLAQSATVSGCGCGEPPGDGDGGTNTDAGSASDAGPGVDAGPGTDAGPGADAGPVADAGPGTDAGSGGSDGGVVIPPVGGLNILDANARACDLVFQAAQPEVPSVVFAAEVQGRFVSRAPLVSASIVARQDQTLQGIEILQFEYLGTQGAVTLVKSECFDASGNALSGTVVEFAP